MLRYEEPESSDLGEEASSLCPSHMTTSHYCSTRALARACVPCCCVPPFHCSTVKRVSFSCPAVEKVGHGGAAGHPNVPRHGLNRSFRIPNDWQFRVLLVSATQKGNQSPLLCADADADASAFPHLPLPHTRVSHTHSLGVSLLCTLPPHRRRPRCRSDLSKYNRHG